MFDFAGPQPQSERAEGAVRRRMRITAHDHHSRLRRAKLGGDHVYDALIRRREIEQLDPEFLRVGAERVELARGDGIVDGQGAIAGRDIVIDRGQRALRAPHRAAGRSQARECLRRGDFMHEVQVHVQQGHTVRELLDDVCIPDPVEQRLCRAGDHARALSVSVSRAGFDFARRAFPSSVHGIIARSSAPTFSIGCCRAARRSSSK